MTRSSCSVDVYMICYFLIFGFSMLFISVDNFSMTTTISAVASCLNNIGPGLDIVGPVGNFSQFSDFSKLVLTADMLIGRLEIFPILFLFAPSVWRQKPKNQRRSPAATGKPPATSTCNHTKNSPWKTVSKGSFFFVCMAQYRRYHL